MSFMIDKCRGSRILYDPNTHGPRDADKKATCPHCGRKFFIAFASPSGKWQNAFPVHVPREPKRTGLLKVRRAD